MVVTRQQLWGAMGLFCLIALCGSVVQTHVASRAAAASASDESSDEKPSVVLDDGVYPVVGPDDPLPDEDADSKVVELVVVAVEGDELSTPRTIRLTDRPLLRFHELSHFDFKFEKNECTEIGFSNTPELKAYTRGHVGAQLAVVVDNRVISHHKIREPIESDTVRITCCTVGGGDHLHKHLKVLKLASESNHQAEKKEEEEDER